MAFPGYTFPFSLSCSRSWQPFILFYTTTTRKTQTQHPTTTLLQRCVSPRFKYFETFYYVYASAYTVAAAAAAAVERVKTTGSAFELWDWERRVACLYIYSLPSSSSFFFYITPSLFLCMCFVLRLSSLARALKDNHAILTGRTCASSPYLSTLCVCKHTPKTSSAISAAARERASERLPIRSRLLPQFLFLILLVLLFLLPRDEANKRM